ncbi:MAG: glycosyltransferase family 4 protein [Thermodesulfobacteriota bacterium]
MGGQSKPRCTFVVSWFGAEVPGGAEAEARRTAQNLAEAGVQVQVLTTCLGGLGADWDVQAYPEGRGVEAGLPVIRYATAKRDGARFNALNARVMAGEPLSEAEERDFLHNMVHSPGLFQHIARHPEQGPFFFIPYLFTPSVLGPLIHPEKSVIIPCLHDEGYARLAAVRRAFEAARAVVFHVPAERDLAAGLYDLGRTEPLLLGEGIDTGWSFDADRFRQKYGLTAPFLLYAGRKDAGKNVPLLIQYFLRYQQEGRGPEGLKLVLIGNLKAPIPPGGEKHVIDLGFVPLQDKYDAYAAAAVLAQPSLMESFSIVIMEAWLAGTPVMVHSGCAVTRQHVETSGGGLHFGDYPRFAEGLDLMLGDPALMARMAAQGREYVLKNYSWPEVTQRYHGLIERLCAEPTPPAKPDWQAPLRQAARRGKGPAVHQLLADFAFGDAIGNEVLAYQKLLRSWGLESEIYAVNQDPRLRGRARSISDYAAEAGAEDVVLFHFSIGHELADRLPELPGRKVMRYHNITPAEFLAAVNPTSAERSRQGRRQLAELAPRLELGLGCSAFNCAELTAAGCPAVAEVPIFLDLAALETPPDLNTQDRFSGSPCVLHVGRIAPNKKIEDLIKTQYWLSRLAPGARLLLVGSEGGWAPYAAGLRELARELGASGVHFSGHVTQAQLMAYYRAASLYLCLSEHEGFCVPLVESMHFGLPIVAFDSTGVSGTLAEGGVLLPRKDPLLVAELVARVLADPALSQALKQAARARLERFRPAVVAADLKRALADRLGLKLPPEPGR